MDVLTARQLEDLKRRHFGPASVRAGIPLQFYELTPEMIEAEEQRLGQEKQRKAQERQQRKRDWARLHPTRGEVSFQRRVRREVGDY